MRSLISRYFDKEAADLKVLRNLTHKTLEGELPDEQLS
jgi:hypothetical protein